MLSKQSFDEIRVYAGIAERTGVQFERNVVRRSAGCCTSLTELARKARASGDGCFYLPLKDWPAGKEQLDLLSPWVVLPRVLRIDP
jgi:hypothetical protein